MHTSSSSNSSTNITNISAAAAAAVTITDDRQPYPPQAPPPQPPQAGILITAPPPDILRVDSGGAAISTFRYTIPGRPQYQLSDLADLNYMINQSRAFGHPDPAALIYPSTVGGAAVPLWPPRSYTCTFCRRDFASAQALGGHMNVHRRDRARLRRSSPPGSPTTSADSGGVAASYAGNPAAADIADSSISIGTSTLPVSAQIRGHISRADERPYSVGVPSSSFRPPELLHLYPNSEDPHLFRQPSDAGPLPENRTEVIVQSHNYNPRYNINAAAEASINPVPSDLEQQRVNLQQGELELQHGQFYNRPAAALLMNAPSDLDLELRLGRSLAAARNNNNHNNDNNIVMNNNNINRSSPARGDQQE